MPSNASKPKPRYKWAYPSDWLEDFISDPEREPIALRAVIRDLMSKLAEDDIQDLFQTEMDADGYFRNLDACVECNSTRGPHIPHGSADAYCEECGADWLSEDH